MEFFDPQHLGWAPVLIPAIALAMLIALDNRYIGPYFPILDVVFNEFGTDYSWRHKEIVRSLTRRFIYVTSLGALLNWCGYQFPDAVAVFFVAGFLMIWPAFFHPLPVYASKADWQVLLVWGLYVLTIAAAGSFGARALALIQALSGQSTQQFARGLFTQTAVLASITFALTAFRVPLQRKLWRRRPKNPEERGAPDG
ncbi:hypothetical protein [Mycobacterium marinum]|uniref:hypothetical protein n=1 Tax=Mycobacterium marinum TaxID=1781 RepID=UPI003566DBD9